MMSLVCDGCSTPWSEVVVLRIQWEKHTLKTYENLLVKCLYQKWLIYSTRNV